MHEVTTQDDYLVFIENILQVFRYYNWFDVFDFSTHGIPLKIHYTWSINVLDHLDIFSSDDIILYEVVGDLVYHYLWGLTSDVM